jgi:hypothetical protein
MSFLRVFFNAFWLMVTFPLILLLGDEDEC